MEVPKIFALLIVTVLLALSNVAACAKVSVLKPSAKPVISNNLSSLETSLRYSAVEVSPASTTNHLYGSNISPKVVSVPPLVTATLYKLIKSLASAISLTLIERLLPNLRRLSAKVALATASLKVIASVELKPLIETATALATLKLNVSLSVSPLIIEIPVLFAMLKISFSVSSVEEVPPKTLNLLLPVTSLTEILFAPAPPATVTLPSPLTVAPSTEIVSASPSP